MVTEMLREAMEGDFIVGEGCQEMEFWILDFEF